MMVVDVLSERCKLFLRYIASQNQICIECNESLSFPAHSNFMQFNMYA